MKPTFRHTDLKLIQPGFDSPLTDVLIELEHLRRLQLYGDTPVNIFFQIKELFHLLESLGSARIEGNHTTLSDYIETKIDPELDEEERFKEIANIEEAMAYLEEHIDTGSEISNRFLCELHAIIVNDLVREGDDTPGLHRKTNVRIAGSKHQPPDSVTVQGYMDELITFINGDHANKYDLIKVALAHHRFCWTHPFKNGNGRAVRLLTYAMLIKYGFNVKLGQRVLNPTAVFCNNRNTYYEMLGHADTGTEEGLETWCHYVLKGVKEELVKVDRLSDYGFIKERILTPATNQAREQGLIKEIEQDVLQIAINQGIFKSSDIERIEPDPRKRTYLLKKLHEAKLIAPIKPGARSYTICFSNSILIRGVMKALVKEGFTPPLDDN